MSANGTNISFNLTMVSALYAEPTTLESLKISISKERAKDK